VSGGRDDRPADVEVGARWRAGSAPWRVRARTHTEAVGDVESEELRDTEGLPDSPQPGRPYRSAARRWHFATWLREGGR
jgi:hypothetical protein